MVERVAPYSIQQIGTTAVRFPSGAPIPSITDASVDPYYRTRTSKEVHVDGVLFWPQEPGPYPGVVLLHDRWGLTAQFKDLGLRLAREGYMVLVPNLYGRQGGTVTANSEVADALAARIKEPEILQDINSCCEFLNTREQLKKNVHAVVGFGLGGSLALPFACQRKRLRAAVAYYGTVTPSPDTFRHLMCPVLYHRAGVEHAVTDEQMERLRRAGQESGKPVEILSYDEAAVGFIEDSRPAVFRPDAAAAAWDATITFLKDHVQTKA